MPFSPRTLAWTPSSLSSNLSHYQLNDLVPTSELHQRPTVRPGSAPPPNNWKPNGSTDTGAESRLLAPSPALILSEAWRVLCHGINRREILQEFFPIFRSFELGYLFFSFFMKTSFSCSSLRCLEKSAPVVPLDLETVCEGNGSS